NLMINDPLLIRRPLLQVGELREVGFDRDKIAAWIGLEAIDTSQQMIRDRLIEEDLQTCPKSNQPHHIPCKVTEG
ncbi:MAG TPA: hypothetical protein DEG17_23945, partial [Cyanobacteria bacterium UBA11149]|nr:hypothetical protein [Cyanobacteria bacterium UBA11149]